MKTKYDNVPNLELSIRHSFDTFDGSAAEENRFVQIDPTARLEFIFWKDFVLEADYTFTYYENRTINEINRFQTANASLRYNKESSPWGIELNATNIFDIQLRNENSINQFLISDTRTFVQPRILLLKVAYKI